MIVNEHIAEKERIKEENCPLEKLKPREINCWNRELGNAEWQVKKGLYPDEGYSIGVDTF